MGKDNQFELLLRQTRRLQVGACRVDLALNEVHRDGGSVRLTPKAAGVLEVLLYTAGQAVSKERLLAEVWRGEFPTDDVVTHAIGELRRAFGDDPRNPVYIRTLPRVGYALIADVGPLERIDDAATPPDAPSPAADVTATSPASRAPLMAILALLLIPVAIALAMRWLPGEDAAQASGAPQPAPVTSLPGVETFPSLSPDASLLAFSSTAAAGEPSRVFVQVVGSDSARRVSTVESDAELAPVFSPDGRRLLFQRRRGDMCAFVIASVLGGDEREFPGCSVRLILHVEWAPDGNRLLLPVVDDATSSARLHLIDLVTGASEEIDYPVGEGTSDVQARYSPDGRFIAFRRGAIPHSDLYVMRADGSNLRRLTEFNALMPGFDWTPDARAIVFSSNHGGPQALWRVDVASAQARPLGINDVWWPDMARLRDELVFMRESSPLHIAEVTLDGEIDAEPRRLAASSGMDFNPVVSPDGARIAFVSDRRGELALYVADRDGTNARRLSPHGRAEIAELRWAADGRHLLYVVRGGGTRLLSVDAATGVRTDLTPDGHTVMSAAFAPDGGSIVFSSDASGQWTLWRQTLPDGTPEPLGDFVARHPQFRDDDHLVYVGGNEVTGLYELELSTGTVTRLDAGMGYWNQRAWVLADDGIYAFHGEGQLGIYRLGHDGGGWQLVEPLRENTIGHYHLSLDPDARHAILTVLPRVEGDILRISHAQSL